MSENKTTAVDTYQPFPNADPMLALVERAARDPNIDVGKMERLLDLAEKVHARNAQTEYDAAMSAAQAEMRPVANDSDNPQTRSRYASYGALYRALRPIYTQHGFSLSFGTRSPAPDLVTILCRVSHRAGHTERVEIQMPADGKGAKGGDVMSKTHATGSAVSYGMRYLLKMIFNVATGEYDDDGNAAGAKLGGAPHWKDNPSNQPAAQPAPQRPPAETQRPGKPKNKAEAAAAWTGLLGRCKTKLLAGIPSEEYWAWWGYGVDQSWILGNESLAEARADKMFEGAKSVADIPGIKDKHQTAVEAFMANCPKDLYDDLNGRCVPMALPASSKLAEKPAGVHREHSMGSPNACPRCKGTATRQSEDYEAVKWCQKCGFQWDQGGKAFEAHPWQFAMLPFAPKDETKKDYKGKTLGELSRIDSKYWFGIVMNFEAKGWKGKPPSEESVRFEEACKLGRLHIDSKKTVGGGAEPPTLQEEQDDDIPF